MLKKKLTQVIDFTDKYFYFLLIAVSALIFIFNYNSSIMESILTNHLDYKKIISGFDREVIEAAATPTFPMWGYGWVLAVTENRFAILLFQIIVANFALLYLLRALKNYQLLGAIGYKYFKFLVLLSVPYFAINITLSPYGLANTLFIFSFVFLLKGMHENKLRYFVVSGILFGLTLNFRSDLIYFPVVLLTIIIFTTKTDATRKVIQLFCPWLLAAFVVIAPWGMYTKHVTGHYLFGSTNSGHVFFIGLGQLPNNVWGITAIDGDPVMTNAIEQHFGVNQSSLIYESDVFLKKYFIQLVKAEPVEYVKKCAYSFLRSLVDGTYVGQYYLFNAASSTEARWGGDIEFKNWRASVMSNPAHVFDDIRIGNIAQMVLELFFVAMKFVSLILLPFTIWHAIKHRDFFALLVVSIVLYQIAILVFAFNMRLYSTNVYMFYMINMVLAYTYFKGARVDKGSSKPA